MTAAQLKILSDTILDKSGTPYFTPAEFTRLFNMSYDIWVRLNWKRFEQDSEMKYKMRLLTMPFEVLNNNQVDLSTIAPALRYDARVRATFKRVCGINVDYITRSCTPVENNRIDVMESDPFNRGIDEEPTYIQTTTAAGLPIFQIFSETVPVKVDGLYVRQPTYIDLVNFPNVVFEQPDDLAEEIVSICDVDEETVIENYNRMNAEKSNLVATKMAEA